MPKLTGRSDLNEVAGHWQIISNTDSNRMKKPLTRIKRPPHHHHPTRLWSAAQSTMEFQRVLWTISERQGSQSRCHNVLYRAFVMLIHTNIHLVIFYDDDHPKIIITYKRTFHSAHPIRPLKQQQQRPVHLSPHKQSTVFHSFSTSVEPKAPNESIQNSHHGGW